MAKDIQTGKGGNLPVPTSRAVVPTQKPLKKATDWDLESPYDAPTSIQELIDMAPFREASDSKGGSYTAAARIPTWAERKIQWFIEMKGSPYQLKGDVVRDAIYLGLRILHARYKGNPDWAQESKMADAISKVGVSGRLREQVTRLTEGLRVLWDEGDEDQAIEGLEQFVGAVVEMNDDWQKSKTIQYIKGDRLLKQVVERCSVEVKRAVLGERK